MAEVIKKQDLVHRAAPDAVGKRSLHPVLLYYVVARDGDSGIRLPHALSEFREEVLVVFSSREMAHDFFLSDVFRGTWHVRECSAGELVSLLLGLYKDIEWVLFNPSSRVRLTEEGNQPNLTGREDFIDYLLG